MRALALTSLLILVGPLGCLRSARPHRYEVQVRQPVAPFDTSPGPHNWVRDHDCGLWETTYAWRELQRDRRPERPERLEVRTRCVSGPARVPSRSGKSVGRASPQPIEVEVESKGQTRLLETFNITEEVTVVRYRDGAGDLVTVDNASEVQFWENVVVIRKRDGGGLAIPPRDFLGIEW